MMLPSLILIPAILTIIGGIFMVNIKAIFIGVILLICGVVAVHDRQVNEK